MPSKRRESLDKFNQGFLHVIINDSVSGKSNADTTPIQRQISCNIQNDKKLRVNANMYSI